MDDFLNKNFILSYEEYLNEQIDKYLTTLTPEEKEAKLKELLLNAKLKDQGISATIAQDKDFQKATVKKENPNIVVATNMASMPGYEKIEEDIKASKNLKEMLQLEETSNVVEHLEVKSEIEKDDDPNTASIYRQDALSAVKKDLEDQKERISTPERATKIAPEPIEEKVELEDKPKILTLEKNDPWGSADGIKHVTPGQNI